MARSSLAESQHPSPPYYSRGTFEDSWRQWNRYLRKERGLPTSEDVAYLARVLSGLKNPVNEALGSLGPFTYGTIAVPHFPALYNEDLLDAAAYTGFQLTIAGHTPGDTAQWPLTDIGFACAGMGIGLCGHHRDRKECSDEIRKRPEMYWRNAFTVSYTKTMLTAHVPAGCGGVHWYYFVDSMQNSSLGTGLLHDYPLSNLYWEDVDKAISAALDSSLNRGHVLAIVVVHGESAHDAKFLSILKRQVREHQDSKTVPPFFGKETLFAGALGTAELSNRCMYGDLPELASQTCDRCNKDGNEMSLVQNCLHSHYTTTTTSMETFVA